jgi:hypothetical protein
MLAAVLRHAAPDAAEEIDPASVPNIVMTVPLIIAAVFVIVAFLIYLGMQPPVIQVTAESFTVSGAMYSNTIPLGRIKSASLDDQIPRVRGKTNGFDAGNTLRGSFRVDSWGSARLYVDLNHPPFIVLRSDDRFVAVNFANPQATRDTYAQLRQALDRSR